MKNKIFEKAIAQIGYNHYVCHQCVNGVCDKYISPGPCQTNCSECKKQYRCNVCRDGECKAVYFDTPCTDNCFSSGRCQNNIPGVRFHTVCEGSHCKTTDCGYAAICQDQCTGPEQCGGSSEDWEYCCNARTHTCYQCHHGIAETRDACERNAANIKWAQDVGNGIFLER